MNNVNFCTACGEALPPAAKFCNQCGHPAAKASDSPAPQKVKWYHNTAFVLFMLFFVLQVFGLPLVWSHPRFSRSTKITLTVITVVATIVLTLLTAGAVKTIVDRMLTENSELKSLLAY